jgi:hypothetical protein
MLWIIETQRIGIILVLLGVISGCTPTKKLEIGNPLNFECVGVLDNYDDGSLNVYRCVNEDAICYVAPGRGNFSCIPKVTQ